MVAGVAAVQPEPLGALMLSEWAALAALAVLRLLKFSKGDYP